MHLIRIGQTIINLDNVTDMDINPYAESLPTWKVGVNFTQPAQEYGGYHRVFEGSEAAQLMDWIDRNVLDVQDWRAEKAQTDEVPNL